MIEKDLYVEQYALPVRIDIPQGTNVQQIKFSFRDIVPAGTPRIYLEKPSGTEIYNNASDYDWDAVPPYAVFDTTTQMTAEHGQLPGQVRVTDSGDKILNSFPITVNVVESPSTDNAIESSDEFTALDQALADVQPAIDALNSTNTAVQKAESARVTAEQGRVTAEQERVKAESARVTAEQGRVDAEADRVTAEQGRVTAERGRVTAENERVSEFNQIKEEFEDAEITATASTGEPGSSVIVESTGTGLNKNFAFTIPRGDKGDKGDTGDPGQIATSSQLGVIKVGNGLAVDSTGLLTAKASSPLTVGSSGVGLSYDSETLALSNGKLTVNSGLANFMGTGRTYYTSGDPMTVTVDMFSNQIIAPCTIINPTTGVIVVDDGK